MANFDHKASALRQIRLVRVAHVYYTHRDIEKARQFLEDFGFQEAKRVDNTIYYCGTGPDAFVYCAKKGSENEFGGAAFVVESMEELEYASQTLPNATKVYKLADAPGGGHCVTFKDPVDGFPFHLVYGQASDNATALPQLQYNFPTEKYRPGNATQRFKNGPAPVHKLGHFGMCVTDLASALKFYTTRFNFSPSDSNNTNCALYKLIHDPSGKDITAFLHLDRDSELVDHHCFFFFEGPKSHVHHSSFETHDFDTQLLGHHWLRNKGYENCWGVGRHIMGSQIFDYWFDPSRFILEHYVDGDLVNNESVTHRTLASKDNLHVWGPDLPPDFLE
ncbi:Metapyrocatechase 2 [Tolypocladium ophioglossoides CBS 100239]|uniref:Metapyrocatechase 2 n=1 Tax=Tolypocladium ophioglossoides (strain CBS 100239) TaxID=1163406 RepID=A0A0L0NH40_TOLOC|nr:Metapyrocatechase 2 [Tolypocladium ophioglossoides CBS 100239]